MRPLPTWPALSIADWKDTQSTLHMWTQIIGKIRTTQVPWINHSWHTTLYVTPRGLTTLAMPVGEISLQVDFDFLGHNLHMSTSAGAQQSFTLEPMSVAEFDDRVKSALDGIATPVNYHHRPNEVDPSVPFAKDQEHASYDPASVERLHQALVRTDQVMQQFRAKFRGKCSPVHFFWGSFDMAVTRFSGRTAPPHPGGFPNMPDWITREAYSHEVSSCGFWPGGGEQEAFFYSYAYPTPDGFADQPCQPAAALFSKDMGEFILPYAAIQQSAMPNEDLLAFFQSTYEAAVVTAAWDRKAVEWDGPARG